MKKAGLSLILFFLFVTVSLASDIPRTISLQGYLTDTSGVALTGYYYLTFSIYENEDDIDPLWSSIRLVDVSEGYYHVYLGEKAPLDIPFDRQYYLGVRVGFSAEMTPRLKLSSSPYALNLEDSGVVGPEGPPGSAGEDGLHCWDINEDGNCSPGEDITGDGVCDANDCIGPQGDKGDKGDTGDTGIQGPQGDKGDTGIQGPQGDTGAQGPRGDKGDTGDIGPQGPRGDKGDTGAQGPQGDKGDTGDTGAKGPQGDKGDTGDIGSQGPQGDKGDTGIQGPRGDKGDTGDTGDTGIQGPQGDKGDIGSQGPQGDTGAQGLQGDIGPQGPQGDKGDTGMCQ
ncbi:MAG: hypothetical protein V1816_06855 [Pseudomonadota bacterium]